MVKNKGCWRPIKRKNRVYTHGAWHNPKEHLLVEIISDIGFGKQRNVVVQDTKTQTLSGLKIVKVGYLENEKKAKKYAKDYMAQHNRC